jgi:hypothetical protein
MPIANYVPLEAPSLVQEVDLLPYVYATVQSASEDVINDFSPHSPIAAQAEGLDFAMRELRYAINRMSYNVAINTLKIAGVQRRLGAKAEVLATFTISAPLGNPYLISAGYMVSAEDGTEFLTTQNLVIPAGNISGSVLAEAKEMGRSGNVAAGAIRNLSESRAFLQSVTNLEAATGGLGEETVDEVLSRGFAALRYRGVLITADDFEREAERILGQGSVVRAIGGLGSNQVDTERGAVHLFVLNADGSLPSVGQLISLKQQMDAQAPTFLQEQKTGVIATGLYTSPMQLYPIELYTVVQLLPGDNPETRAQAIYNELKAYLQPGNLPLGRTITRTKLENTVQRSGVDDVASVTVHIPSTLNPAEYEVSYGDVGLPNRYTIAALKGVSVDAIDSAGNHFIYIFGDVGDPE